MLSYAEQIQFTLGISETLATGSPETPYYLDCVPYNGA